MNTDQLLAAFAARFTNNQLQITDAPSVFASPGRILAYIGKQPA